MYTRYEDYLLLYKGSALTREQWPAAQRAAEAYVDRLTYGRLNAGEPVTDAVRMAVCAVAEVYGARTSAQAAGSAGVKSVSTDGYSEAYEDRATLNAAFDAECRAAADLYLPPADPLRYAGATVRRRRWLK